jgi:hypothetical protein
MCRTFSLIKITITFYLNGGLCLSFVVHTGPKANTNKTQTSRFTWFPKTGYVHRGSKLYIIGGMLYYLENVELTECMTCGHSRYKPRTGRGKTLVAYKKLRYFPITATLQRLFMSPRTAEHMT